MLAAFEREEEQFAREVEASRAKLAEKRERKAAERAMEAEEARAARAAIHPKTWERMAERESKEFKDRVGGWQKFNESVEPTKEEIEAAQDAKWAISEPAPCFEQNFSTRKKAKVSSWESTEKSTDDRNEIDEVKAKPILTGGFSMKMPTAKAKPKFGVKKS